jgi:hypothetical protein
MPETYFSDAPEVHAVGADLIFSEREFEHLEKRLVLYFFQSEAPKRDGKAVYGTAEIVRGKNATLYWNAKGQTVATPFYLIIFSEDIWRHLDDKQKQFLVRHELRHCVVKMSKQTKSLKMALKKHDVEMFLADLADPCMKEVCDIWDAVKKANPQPELPLGEDENEGTLTGAEIEAIEFSDGVNKATLNADSLPALQNALTGQEEREAIYGGLGEDPAIKAALTRADERKK